MISLMLAFTGMLAVEPTIDPRNLPATAWTVDLALRIPDCRTIVIPHPAGPLPHYGTAPPAAPVPRSIAMARHIAGEILDVALAVMVISGLSSSR